MHLLCMYVCLCMYLCRVCIHECMCTFVQCYHSFLPLTWVSLAESQRAMALSREMTWDSRSTVHQTRPM